MAFCINCGKELAEDAKFCSNCGAIVGTPDEQRKTSYDGAIHKCPNCGEVLKAFEINCPSCGYELRDRKSSSSIQEFSRKLNNAETDEQRILLLRSFPIPNTKEDIMEYMILASANVDENLSKDISSAWKAKTEQAFQKAQILFQDEQDISRIQYMYTQVCTKSIAQKRRENVKKAGNTISELLPVLPNLIVVTV